MIKVGRVYKAAHTTKGTFKCRIVYIAKSHIFATITDIGTVWSEAEVGDDVRMLKRMVKFYSKDKK